jgi:hypothetical protein
MGEHGEDLYGAEAAGGTSLQTDATSSSTALIECLRELLVREYVECGTDELSLSLSSLLAGTGTAQAFHERLIEQIGDAPADALEYMTSALVSLLDVNHAMRELFASYIEDGGAQLLRVSVDCDVQDVAHALFVGQDWKGGMPIYLPVVVICEKVLPGQIHIPELSELYRLVGWLASSWICWDEADVPDGYEVGEAGIGVYARDGCFRQRRDIVWRPCGAHTGVIAPLKNSGVACRLDALVFALHSLRPMHAWIVRAGQSVVAPCVVQGLLALDAAASARMRCTTSEVQGPLEAFIAASGGAGEVFNEMGDARSVLTYLGQALDAEVSRIPAIGPTPFTIVVERPERDPLSVYWSIARGEFGRLDDLFLRTYGPDVRVTWPTIVAVVVPDRDGLVMPKRIAGGGHNYSLAASVMLVSGGTHYVARLFDDAQEVLAECDDQRRRMPVHRCRADFLINCVALYLSSD